MSQYPYQGQDPNQPPQQYGGYAPNQGSGQPQPQPTYGENPYGQAPQQPYNQPPQQPYSPPQQPPYGQTAYGQNQPPYGQTQPPYGQPQAPYGQNPYGQQQVPYGQAPVTSIKAMHPAYLTALIGGAVAFIAYFLPYATYSYLTVGFSFSGAQLGAQFWLEFLLALGAIAVTLVLQFGNQWFGKSQPGTFPARIVSSATMQHRTWVISLLSIGGAGVVLHLILMLTGIGAYAVYGVGWGFGAILYLLGMLAVTAGGFLALRPDMLARITKRS